MWRSPSEASVTSNAAEAFDMKGLRAWLYKR